MVKIITSMLHSLLIGGLDFSNGFVLYFSGTSLVYIGRVVHVLIPLRLSVYYACVCVFVAKRYTKPKGIT